MTSAKGNFMRQLFVLLAVLVGFNTLYAQYPERPNPPRLVNDFAGFLTSDEAGTLERKLVAYNDSTSTQITIVGITSLDGADKAQYATELGEKWGVGGKANDNGVVILISKEDRQVFIATGRGVEQYLPDAICKRIVTNKIIPYFKQGDFYGGLNAATDEMIARLSGTFVNDEPRQSGKRGIPLWVIILVIIFVFIVLPMLFGGGGGGGTTFGGRGYRSYGGFGGFGGFGGGSWGGGGSSGGGFGGFGGGSFGGGGSGGSW